MEDNEIGLRLVEKAGDSLEGECQIGSMQCRKKVEKGVTFASRCVDCGETGPLIRPGCVVSVVVGRAGWRPIAAGV